MALDCGRFILQLQYWTDVKRNDFGYRFGYRHQFGQITLNYAKWLFDNGLSGHANLRSISLIYHRFTVFFRDLKFAGSNPVGVRVPLRAPSYNYAMWFNLFTLMNT